MRRFKASLGNQDQTFKVQFNTDSIKEMKMGLKQEGDGLKLDFTNLSQPLNTEVTTSDTNFETKTDINNTPVDDEWYDEIIYYDGGGVDGYGN